jgi:tRNA(Ile)-lysidine synthase
VLHPYVVAPHPVLLGIRRFGLAPNQRVLVAVSGGPDSTALLMALHDEGHDIVAAHYDHALQPASDQVAAHVRALCQELGVEVVMERRNEPMPRGSVQAGARQLRYDFLERARVSARAGVVAIAHTADDVVEGTVLHLMRGCGLAGFRGMPARRGVFVRPLVGVWRTEVLDYLRRRGIEALEDPANANTAFERVRIRREVLPALERDRPGITRRFYGAATRAAALQEKIQAAAELALRGTTPSRTRVAATPQPIAAELMKLLYTRAGGAQPALSRRHVSSMLRLAQPGRGGRGVDLPGGKRFRIVGDSMEIIAVGPGAKDRKDGEETHLDVVPCAGCDDQSAVHLKPGLALTLAYRSPGLTMRPLGGRGTRKLQDIFVDARVPREDRDAWPLVFAGGALAAVPGIAVDARFASSPGESGVHVTINGFPATVESPNSRPGDPT